MSNFENMNMNMNTNMNTKNILSINVAGSQSSIGEFKQNTQTPVTIYDHHLAFANTKCKELLILNGFLLPQEDGTIAWNKALYEVVSTLDQVYPDPYTNRYNPWFNPNTILDLSPEDESIFGFSEQGGNTFYAQWHSGYSLLSEQFIDQILRKLSKKKGCENVSPSQLRETLYKFDNIARKAFIYALQCVKEMFPDKAEECSIEKFHQEFYEHRLKTVYYVLDYVKRNNTDIVFLQELNIPMYQEFNTFCSSEDSEYNLIVTDLSETHPVSAFLIKKSIPFSVVSPEIDNTSEVMNETIILEIEDVYYVNTHLSSKDRKKADGRPKNYQDQIEILLNWCKTKSKWVIGGDLNHHPEPIENTLIFPQTKEVKTTRKMRTWLQAQPGKADILAEGCCDHFYVCGCNFVSSRICMVGKPEFDNVSCDNISLPNLFSVGDHFAVSASITI